MVFNLCAIAVRSIMGEAYVVLLLVSPSLLVPSEKEKLFYCATSPLDPLPLPSLFDPPSVGLSVIIPAFNETKRLTPMLEAALAHLNSIKARSYEIVIVDDGSGDGTVALAISLAQKHSPANIRIVQLDKNVGKGGAVRHGSLHARGERLLMADADGASRFEDLELLWKAMDDIQIDNKAIAVGSRAHMVNTEAVVKRSTIRNFLMYGFHFVLRTLGVGHIRDTQCGFKLFSRQAAREIFPTQHLSNWVFDVELLIKAQLLDIPVIEVAIAWHEVPGSKLSLVSDSIGMFRDLIILRVNYALGKWKVTRERKKKD